MSAVASIPLHLYAVMLTFSVTVAILVTIQLRGPGRGQV